MVVWGQFCVLFFSVLLLALSDVRCQTCQLPADLRGRTMISNAVGVVTTTDSSVVFEEGLRSCTAPLCGSLNNLTFNCQENQGDIYFFKSEVITDGSNNIRMYICWYIAQEISSNKWVYYNAPNNRNTFYKSYVHPRRDTDSVSFTDVCNLPTPLPVSRYSLLLDTDSLASQSSTCPDDLLATFNASQTSPACVTEFDVCSAATRQNVIVSNPSCRADNFFTANGKMDCLHSLSQNGVTYVTLFAPENTTVIFSCMTFIAQGGTVYANFQESTCDGLAAPTTAAHDVVMEPTVLCPFPCTFPSNLMGSWTDSRTAQTVTVNGTVMENFFSCSDPPCAETVDWLECYRTENNRYLVRTSVTTIDSHSVRVYICLELTQLSSTKYLYYRLHTNVHDTLGDYVATFNSGQSVSLAQACGDISASPYRATRHHVFVSSGNEKTSFTSCPSGLSGMFNNTDSTCQSTFDTCDDDTQVKVTGTDCSPRPFFSAGGSVGCLHSVTASGVTYVTMYNTDTSPDGATTFAFICVALKRSGSTLAFSQNPLQCVDTQTADQINTTNGALFVYEETGEECDPSSEFDYTIIIIVVAVLLFVIIIIIVIVIICICCRKKRSKESEKKDDVDAILKKEDLEDEERDIGGSNLSLDSGYPHSSTRTESRTGRGGIGSHGFGTPGSNFAEVYEVAEEEDPKEVNVVSHRRRSGNVDPTGKGREGPPEVDQDAEYSDGSWEEYVDEDGNRQVRPKEHRRRRKKIKQTYTRTHVLADGTTVEEEVESEYSVTASSDGGSSDDDRESLSDQIRAQKEKRKKRLQQIMEGGVTATVITTREMDEKANQPEKKRRSFLDKVRRGTRDRRGKAKVHNRSFPNEAGKERVPGVKREIPFLLQYKAKKDIEKTLNDEGFFDDPDEKNMAETVFGFERTDRELSPKPSDFGTVGETEKEGMTTATDSSQSMDKSRSHDISDAANRGLEEGQEDGEGTTRDESKLGATDHASSPVPTSDDGMRGTKEKSKHDTVVGRTATSSTFDSDMKGSTKEGFRKRVTIRRGSVSPAFSLDSDMQDDSSGGKSSDTSSGVADLSPAHHPSSSERNRLGSGGHRDSRRGGVGREKGQGLVVRHSLGLQGFGPGDKDKEGADSRGKIGHGRSKQKQDKRVKTALRRLLNERLFGSSDKKKSRREDDVTGDSWTNADSVANNVSETSSLAGTRGGTRQAWHLTQGKVAFAEVDSNTTNPRGPNGAPRQSELGPVHRFKQHGQLHRTDDDNVKTGRERLSTRVGSNLPPLKTTKSLDHVFTPAHYPKWGLCVTASQRSMLVDGLNRDRTFLSRRQAPTAWSSKTDDSMILPPHSRGKGEEMADDESYLDPHRPDSEEQDEENREGGAWAHRRNPNPAADGANGGPLSFTKTSGRSPLDIDDRRLRRLLEELYKDKKFMDKLINRIDDDHLEFPDHMAAEDVKSLSELGRDYLLDRAHYWELHGPLGPPRAPPTALGLRLSRTQTSVTSTGGRKPSHERASSPRPKTVR